MVKGVKVTPHSVVRAGFHKQSVAGTEKVLPFTGVDGISVKGVTADPQDGVVWAGFHK